MERDYPTNYVPSNIYEMFRRVVWDGRPSQKPKYAPELDPPHNIKNGPHLGSADYRRRLRAELIQHLPGYAEAITDEIEAQLAYNAVGHGYRRSPDIKKRRVWFAARERKYKAREHTKSLTQLIYTGDMPQVAHMDWGGVNVDPVTKAFAQKLRAEWWTVQGPTIVAEARAEILRVDALDEETLHEELMRRLQED